MGEKTRRDFLYVATGACGAVALVGAAWPLVAQLAPNEQTVAERGFVSVDLSQIESGSQVLVIWEEKPYYVRHLTTAEILAAQQTELNKYYKYVPASTRLHSHEHSTPKWSVVSAVCTHMNCRLSKLDTGLEGWVCPCHGAKFDVVGRVIKGPAPSNLPQPLFTFHSEEKLVIGEGETSQNKDAMKQTGH